MFAARYFAIRHYPTRYFAKVGAVVTITRFVEVTLGSRPSYAVGERPAFTVEERPALTKD